MHLFKEKRELWSMMSYGSIFSSPFLPRPAPDFFANRKTGGYDQQKLVFNMAKSNLVLEIRARAMNEPRLEEKCRLLRARLRENIQKRNLLETGIRVQFEELKRLETTLEKARTIHANQHS